MRRRIKTRKAWCEGPFIDYMNAVDRILKAGLHVRTTSQAELETVACAQEERYTPAECAQDILIGRNRLVK